MLSITRVKNITPVTISEFANKDFCAYSKYYMESLNPVARDFIIFCVQRNHKEWPALYDEMCWVAGHRLFRGLGYTELRKVGISLSLTNIEDTIEMVDAVFAQR